jgi:MFS family permease
MQTAANTITNRLTEPPFPPTAVGWYATIMLAFLYWLSVLDRFIISLLVDPIKQDLGITDVQFGMLHGLAFIVTFTAFGLVFGALADRMSRRLLIYIGVSIWSIATSMCGFAANFWHLLIARIGVGVGEASLNPCATSMISDLFPREKLTRAMAVYAVGSAVGNGTALIIGGAIVALVAHLDSITLPLVGEIRPWQAVFMIVGIPGALIAFGIFTVPEPVRRGLRAAQPKTHWTRAYAELFRFMRKRPRFFVCHYLGFTLGSALLAGPAAWYPAYMGRTFNWTAGDIAAYLGPTLLAAGVISKLACGWAVDAMYQRGYRDAQLRWYGISMLLAAPIGVFAMTSPSPWICLAGLFMYMTLVGAFNACAMTALNLVTPNELRGTNVAVFATVAGLLGGASGPLFIAAASEHLFDGAQTIGLGIATLMGVYAPLGGLLLLAGLRPMRQAMADIEQPASAPA